VIARRSELRAEEYGRIYWGIARPYKAGVSEPLGDILIDLGDDASQ
jgi:hypothetical protein